MHHSWRMTLPDVSSARPARWPPGYSSRRFVVGQDEQTSVRIENESFQDVWEFEPVPLDEIEGFVRSTSFRSDGVVYAVHAGQVVGECWSWVEFGQLEKEAQKRGEVWCLCVHPQHRGRGLGRALLLTGVEWLHHRGMRSASLNVGRENSRAKRLYESMGCVEESEQTWHRKDLA